MSLVTNEVGRTIENAPVTGYAGQTVVGGTYSYSDDCGKFTILQEPVLAGLFGSNYYKLYRDSAGNIVSKVSITSAEMKKIEAARKAKEGYFEFNVWIWEWEWKMGTDGTSPPTVLNPLTSA